MVVDYANKSDKVVEETNQEIEDKQQEVSVVL